MIGRRTPAPMLPGLQLYVKKRIHWRPAARKAGKSEIRVFGGLYRAWMRFFAQS